MAILDTLKAIGNALIQPLIEKPQSRVTWFSHGKWRTFTHNDGRVALRRYARQPLGAKVVSNAKQATEYAQATWGLEVDRRGKLPVAPPSEPPAPPLSDRQILLDSRGFYPITRRLPRITPRRPALRR